MFSKVLVSGGEHELKVTTSFKLRDFRRKFLCEPGSIFYVYPPIARVVTEPSWWGPGFKYEGGVRDEPLESHDSWQRLLFYNGKWLGED